MDDLGLGLLAPLGRGDDAVELLMDPSLVEDPGRFWRGAVEVLESLGMNDKAETVARNAMLESPGDPEAVRLLLEIVAAGGRGQNCAAFQETGRSNRHRSVRSGSR